MDYLVNEPYPKIQVTGRNITYAKILLDDYAGKISEDTAIHEYLFQSITNKDLSEVLKGIAKVEMHHLYILGELIHLLGLNPFYCNDKVIPWTSEYVNYNMNLKMMLDIDIMHEKKTIAKYQQDIKVIKDEYIIALLKRIILDEEKHIACLTKLKSLYE